MEGLDALSDTAIGTGLPLVIQRLVSLPEEKAVGADRLKAEAFIESQWSSSILSRKENQLIDRMSLHAVHDQGFDHCTRGTEPAIKRLSEDTTHPGRSTKAGVVVSDGEKLVVTKKAPHVTLCRLSLKEPLSLLEGSSKGQSFFSCKSLNQRIPFPEIPSLQSSHPNTVWQQRPSGLGREGEA